jgi:hypothetical protein
MQRAGLSARRCPRDPVASRFVSRARAAAHAETQPLLLPPPATIPERGCADSTPRTRLPIFGAWRRRTAKDTPQLAARMRSCRLSLLRGRAQPLGTVEAPDEHAAEAAAVQQFQLSDEQRKRLAVREE